MKISYVLNETLSFIKKKLKPLKVGLGIAGLVLMQTSDDDGDSSGFISLISAALIGIIGALIGAASDHFTKKNQT